MSSYNLENVDTQHIREKREREKKKKGESVFTHGTDPCADAHRTWKETLSYKPCYWAMGQLSSSTTQYWVSSLLKEV